MAMKWILGTVAASVSFAGVVTAQAVDAAKARRIDSVFAAFDHTDRPGCALGVGQEGRVIYERGYGMSNLEYGLAITPKSIFHVASISKQFTAFSVGLLADQGKLSIDDDVHKYIPELPDYGKPITIRHLMYHTSGIRDQWELLGWAGWRPDDPITEDDVLEIVTRQKSLNFNPGDENLYSNSGYTLLAIIVKRVSGQRLREFAEANIFRPLDMLDTHFHNDHTMIVPNRTSAYEKRATGGWAISIPVFDNDGATSLQTTVEDLLKWEQNFTSGKVGSRKLIDEAQVSGKLNKGSDIKYGFGLSLENYQGLAIVGHGGADAGYRADVLRFPTQGIAIAVTCNFADASPGQYARSVARVLLEDKLTKPAEAVSMTPVRLTNAELDVVAGVYKNPNSDEAWQLVRKDTALVLTNFGATLTSLGPRRFTLFGLVMDISPPAPAAPANVKVMQGDHVLFNYDRVPAFAPSGAELGGFAGTYWSDELGVSYELKVKDGKLFLARRKFPEVELRPAYADGFISDFGTLRFRREGTKVTGFALTGGRVRRVAFTRAAPMR
ncbi:MAG: serine hydrolase domain-containing protein [Gemmatimonadota bacterium]